MENKIPKTDMFSSNEFTAEMLENELWSVLNKVKDKSINVKSANSIVAAAKEICNISRLRLQYEILNRNITSITNNEITKNVVNKKKLIRTIKRK